MKSLIVCLLLALAVQQSVAMVVSEQWLVPSTLSDTLVAGVDTITWTWGDTLPHDVKFLTYPSGFTGFSANGESGLQIPATPVRAPYTLSFSPTIPGTYTYVCTVHASMRGTLTVTGGAANSTAANSTIPATTVANTTSATAATNATSNATLAQAAIVARTVGLATAAITLNTTSLPTYVTNDVNIFLANTSGPLSLSNVTVLATYLSKNLVLAQANNNRSNVTAPVVKSFVLIDATNALVTAQVPALQHFATILWTYITNGTTFSPTPNWYAKNAVFTPAPVSTA